MQTKIHLYYGAQKNVVRFNLNTFLSIHINIRISLKSLVPPLHSFLLLSNTKIELKLN